MITRIELKRYEVRKDKYRSISDEVKYFNRNIENISNMKVIEGERRSEVISGYDMKYINTQRIFIIMIK
jgi:hypothetical protein